MSEYCSTLINSKISATPTVNFILEHFTVTAAVQGVGLHQGSVGTEMRRPLGRALISI